MNINLIFMQICSYRGVQSDLGRNVLQRMYCYSLKMKVNEEVNLSSQFILCLEGKIGFDEVCFYDLIFCVYWLFVGFFFKFRISLKFFFKKNSSV